MLSRVPWMMYATCSPVAVILILISYVIVFSFAYSMQKVITWGDISRIGRPQGDGIFGQVVGIPENETIEKVIYTCCT